MSHEDNLALGRLTLQRRRLRGAGGPSGTLWRRSGGRRPAVTAGTWGTDAGAETELSSAKGSSQSCSGVKKHPLHEVLQPRLLSKDVVVIVGV